MAAPEKVAIDEYNVLMWKASVIVVRATISVLVGVSTGVLTMDYIAGLLALVAVFVLSYLSPCEKVLHWPATWVYNLGAPLVNWDVAKAIGQAPVKKSKRK